MVLTEESPVYGPFFGVMGAASAIIFTCKLSVKVTKKVNQKKLKFSKALELHMELQNQEQVSPL
jgi:hypothetical protein